MAWAALLDCRRYQHDVTMRFQSELFRRCPQMAVGGLERAWKLILMRKFCCNVISQGVSSPDDKAGEMTMQNREKKLPPRCAFCHGKLGLLVAHYWGLRFCSRHHKEAYLKEQREHRDHYRRWLGYLSDAPPKMK
jgi:hypothetical protein